MRPKRFEDDELRYSDSSIRRIQNDPDIHIINLVGL